MKDPILLYYLGIAVCGLGLLLMGAAALLAIGIYGTALFYALFWVAIGVGVVAVCLRAYVQWREIEEKKRQLVIHVTDSE